MAAVMEEKSVLGLREVVLLMFSTGALFMLIALLTFSNEDAGFSHSGSLQSINNACGVVGAWLADFTLSVFGLMAYLLPVMLAWIGYLIYRGKLHIESTLVIILRYIGFVVTLAFGSALFYMHLLRTWVELPVGTGGILGQELGDFTIIMLGNSGATMVLLTGLLASTTLFTDLSWFKLMDSVGHYTLKGASFVWQAIGGFSGTLLARKGNEIPGFTDAKLAETDSQLDARHPKKRQQISVEPVLEPKITTRTEPSVAIPKQKNPLVSSSRHEPQFSEPEAVKNGKQSIAVHADPLMAPAIKSSAARALEENATRLEPQFDRSHVSNLKTADNQLRTNNYPPVIDEALSASRQPRPDPELTARVMGYDASIERELEEPIFSNYPPLLKDSDLDENFFPSFSATDAHERAVTEPFLTQRNRQERHEPKVPSFSDTHSPRAESQMRETQSHQRSAVSTSTSPILPDLSLLDERDTHVVGYTDADLEEMSRMVEDVLQEFNVVVEVVAVHPGPVITRFELQPAAGVKVSRISGLSKDLARSLSVTSVRIVENIPGKPVIGLEIPNQEREMVTLRELLVSPEFRERKSVLTLAMGKDIAGVPVVADLGKMPHALVAGTTGSGKSVAINTMILSLLYKATPEQVRLIMIDPKMLELSVYEGIPHLLTPVVTDMKEASNALRWAVAEMERRYKLMSKMGVRNIAGFNLLVTNAAAKGETIRDPMFQYDKPLGEFEDFPVLTTLPSIVIVIDELADMMMIVGKKVEELIARLAQKARAAGIHLILATQRPSVDVLTGLIKANVPTRISFQVSSRIDSRTILDQGGAETLLGNGDMLYLPSGTAIPIRAHGAFVDDHEVHRVVEFLKQTAPPNYLDEITREVSESGDSYGGASGDDSESDALYDQAVMFVTESRKASISSVQRKFKVGYNRAARMIEDMEAAGIVSPAESNGSREVLAPSFSRQDDE